MLHDFKNRSRATLVFLLVLMQLIAPLVHGHAGYDTRADGLHIHFNVIKTSASVFEVEGAALDLKANIGAAEAMAVDISVGLKRKTSTCCTIAVPASKRLSSSQPVGLIESISEAPTGLFTTFRLSPPERAPPVII